MIEEHDCMNCSTGCAARHTDEKAEEEISAAPYLILAGLIIVAVSIAVKWLF
jgi:hypothetical protein